MTNLKITELNSSSPNIPSFTDFPEDVQLCILSFLTPSEITTFASTSKRFVSLCKSDSKLWYFMCDRKWGDVTRIKKWGKGRISYKWFYGRLSEYDNLIGFWRPSGQAQADAPGLVLFEWGESCVVGYRVVPSGDGSDRVVKKEFLWIGVGGDGENVGFLVVDGRGCGCGLDEMVEEEEFCDGDEFVPVSLSFMGRNHFVVEENLGYVKKKKEEGECRNNNGFRRSSSSVNVMVLGDDCEELLGSETRGSPGSLPDRLVSEIYQYFANKTSPGLDKRRQRRREKERKSRRKWEPEHFVKIVYSSPSPSRPLQGLWKGYCDGTKLDFYLVTYDDIGGISCRRIGESGYSPVFWTSNATFIEAPLSAEEEELYSKRIHLRPLAAAHDALGQLCLSENELVCRMLHINKSNDLGIPDLAEVFANTRQVNGRIWQYWNGTFGFGFLGDNFIVDLKHIVQDGCLLDTMETQEL